MPAPLIPAFLSDMSARRLAPQSVKTYRWILQDYERFMAGQGKPLETATRIDLKAYMDLLRERPCSHKTASCYFTAFLDDSDGERFLSAKLIAVLTLQGPVHDATLLSLLGIEGDQERCRAIGRQLEELEGYGVVKHGARGWRWLG
ncbi:MAG: phage integrase N-terminal SAM-like domain-containing protein [Methanothrix sp.]